MNEELRHELVRLTYSPEIVSFELTREQGLEILEEIERLNKKLEEKEAILGGIHQLEAEIERLNNIIKYTESWIDRTIEIIKQQPSEDDTWILERLNGIKQCLKGANKE